MVACVTASPFQKPPLRRLSLWSRLYLPGVPTSIYAGASYSMCVCQGQLYFWGQTKTSGEAAMYPKQVQDLGGWEIRSVGCSWVSLILSFMVFKKRRLSSFQSFSSPFHPSFLPYFVYCLLIYLFVCVLFLCCLFVCLSVYLLFVIVERFWTISAHHQD